MLTKTIILTFSDCQDCLFSTFYDPDDVGISFGPTLYCLNAGWKNPNLNNQKVDFNPDQIKMLRGNKYNQYPIPNDCPLSDNCKIVKEFLNIEEYIM